MILLRFKITLSNQFSNATKEVSLFSIYFPLRINHKIKQISFSDTPLLWLILRRGKFWWNRKTNSSCRTIYHVLSVFCFHYLKTNLDWQNGFAEEIGLTRWKCDAVENYPQSNMFSKPQINMWMRPASNLFYFKLLILKFSMLLVYVY